MAETEKTGKPDYYQVLGVDCAASAEELKEALQRKAREFSAARDAGHPDARVNMVQVREAYEVLADPDKRAIYDSGGHPAVVKSGHKSSWGLDVLGVVFDILGEL
jgi:molecular chaperone DnaJ